MMLKWLVSLGLMALYPFCATAQIINDTLVLHMHILDFQSKRPIENVLVQSSSGSVRSDSRGYFQIHVSKRDSLTFGHRAYHDFCISAKFLGGRKQIYLKQDKGIMLKEVEVAGQRYNYVMRPMADTLKTYYMSHKVDTTTKKGDSRKFGGGKVVDLDEMVRSGSLTFNGLISEAAARFNQKELERRKHLDILYAEKFEARYWKVLDDPRLFEDFRSSYGVDEVAFLNYKNYFVQHTDSIKEGGKPDKIREYFFSFYRPYLQAKGH